MKALRRQLWVLAFFDEFVPLYALFALWFLEQGISTSQISIVFAAWAVVALVLEIPSGALADRVERRLLIATAYVCRMLAISVWLLWTSFAGALVGTVLWAVHDALASGAWEAMIYDELDRVGATDRYGALMARLAQAAWVAIAVSAATAWALVGRIGIQGVGWVSVAALVVALVLVLRLPAAPIAEDHDDEPTTYAAWMATLRDGVRTARTIPVLGQLIVLGALVETMTVFEEYIPLLAARGGATETEVPVILGLAWLGFVVGAEVAARHPDLAPKVQAVMLGMAVVVGFVAVQGGGGPWVIVGMAFLHAAVQTTMVLTDARLQERVESATRATVTSVKGFVTGLLALSAFALVGVMDRSGDVRPGLYVLLVPLALTAVLVARWMPRQLPPAP